MPGTLGTTSPGGNTDTTASSWTAEAQIGASLVYTASAGEAVTEVAAYGSGTGSPTCVVGIYAVSAGNPTGSPLGSGTITLGTTAGWYTQAVNIALTGGTTYCVAMSWWQGAAWSMRYATGAGTNTIYSPSIPLPAPWSGSSGSDGNTGSFYATVTAGGATAAPTLDPFTSTATGAVPPILMTPTVVTPPPAAIVSTY